MQNSQEFKTFSDTLACSDRIDAANGQHLRRLHLLQQRGERFVPWGISIIWEEKAFCLPIYVRYVFGTSHFMTHLSLSTSRASRFVTPSNRCRRRMRRFAAVRR